jgi:O-antigen ligase
VQFGWKLRAAIQLGVPFADYYVANQITGTLSHWMTFAGVSMFAFLILLAYIFYAEELYKPLGPPVILASILFVGLVLAYVRNMWVATGVGIVLLVWFWSKWALIPLFVVGLAAVLLVTPIRNRLMTVYQPAPNVIDSRTHREYLRITGYRMIAAHPLLGVGPQQVKQNFLKYYPPEGPHPVPENWYYDHLHNIYIHYAAERGIPALLALMWMILGSALHFSRALIRMPIDDPRRWVLFASLAVIASALVSGWWEFNLNDSEVLGLFLTVIACGYTAAREAYDV